MKIIFKIGKTRTCFVNVFDLGDFSPEHANRPLAFTRMAFTCYEFGEDYGDNVDYIVKLIEREPHLYNKYSFYGQGILTAYRVGFTGVQSMNELQHFFLARFVEYQLRFGSESFVGAVKQSKDLFDWFEGLTDGEYHNVVDMFMRYGN